MRAFKGFTPDLSSRLGGTKVSFEVGKVFEVETSKTAHSGFHCCENPFECLGYYDYRKDVFCVVEAEGSIDEDGAERIACTKLTVKRVLSKRQFAFEGMRYIVEHPDREAWKQYRIDVEVAEEKAKALKREAIGIARGKDPKVEAVAGAYIGLIKEDFPGWVRAAKFIEAPEDGTYWIDMDGEIDHEVQSSGSGGTDKTA